MAHYKYLVIDVDGTLTDGKIYIGANGEMFKAFDVKDGYAIHYILPKHQIIPIIITGRDSEMLKKRCEEIGVTLLFQGISKKLSKLRDVIGYSSFSNVAYIGDDINDLECMTQIKAEGGLVGCPSDAVNEIKLIADFQSTKVGGSGAVREFIDEIITVP